MVLRELEGDHLGELPIGPVRFALEGTPPSLPS